MPNTVSKNDVEGPSSVSRRSVSIDDLSLEEKASLLSGADFWSTCSIANAGVDSVVLTDGPHGVRRQVGATDHLGIADSETATCFPPAAAVGSSWDTRVAELIGEAVGREARALGVGVVLGPGINMKRSPLCGRNFEYYSEDPLLSGSLGAANVRGLGSEGVGAAVKHFAANNQETERMRISVDVDARTLREIYLPAFEQVVTEAAPAMVMSAYNKINGVSASENHWLLTDVLREEWGFAGVVVSDWGGVSDPVASVRAGLDLEMPGTAGRSTQAVVDAVRSGELQESVIDSAAERVLGLSQFAFSPEGETDFKNHHELARRLATQCAVLLKNEGDVLPLETAAPLAVIGDFARVPRIQGGGSSRINASRIDVPLDCIRESAADADRAVTFAPGFSAGEDENQVRLRDEAVEAARTAGVAVVFAGLAEEEESEGFDRKNLDLPANQIALIRAVAEVAQRTVVILSHGGVVRFEEWHDDVDAILDCSLLGQAGGGAIADILFGIANPSGRLAETIPVSCADGASFVNFPGEQGHVRYGEGVMIGYRWHESTQRPARYPFGHGLSYTKFTTSDVIVTVEEDETVDVTLTVTNTGDRAGAHVVQIYVGTEEGPVRRPVRELRAFEKIHLAPGTSRTVTLTLERRAFTYWDIEESGWVVAPGSYRVQICENAATVLHEETVELVGDEIVRPLTMNSTVEDWMTHPIAGPTLSEALGQAGSDTAGAALTPDLLRMISSMPMQKVVDMLGEEAPAELFDTLMERSAQVASDDSAGTTAPNEGSIVDEGCGR